MQPNPRPNENQIEDDVEDTGIPAPQQIDVKWLFDYDYLWLMFEANLRGGSLKRNSVTGQWEFLIPKNSKPFMNEKGIKDVIALFRANVNVISGSSIFQDENRIYQICQVMAQDLTVLLYENLYAYELDESKFDIVITTFMTAFESNLRKSLKGMALIYALQGERVIETRTIDKTPQRGLIRKIFG